MENLVMHIVLPKCLRLVDGRTLGVDSTLSVVSAIVPFYASVAQVKLAGGSYLSKLSDLTVACKIYEVGKDIDSYSYNVVTPPTNTDPTGEQQKKYKLWTNARQNYVTLASAKDLILNVYDLSGSRGSKTLGNFSVNRMALMSDEGMPKLVTSLEAEAKNWLITVKSGGVTGPGGAVRGTIAAKGKYDPDSAPPGRLWVVTGLGANKKTIPGYGSANGKPIKYASAPMTQWRSMRFMGSYVSTLNRAPY